MNDDARTQEFDDLGRGPDDLDGHTMEELSEYLDAGREPRDPSIEESAGCRLALDALERLQLLSDEMLEAEAREVPETDEGWMQRILSSIAFDARAGRRIPLPAPEPGVDLGITEGAVRGLVRGAERAVPGIVIGRCRLLGDVTVPDEAVTVSVEISVPYGEPIPRLVELLRSEISSRLRTHTRLRVAGIDVLVSDVRPSAVRSEGER